MIRHHPSDTILFACAAGRLAEPHARIVAVHAACCPQCAEALRQAETFGGALLQTLAPVPLAPDALQRSLERLDIAPVRADPPPAPVTLAALQTGRWRWAGPGIAIMKLIPRDKTNSRLDLIRVAPGTALLGHGHGGFEMTCVLQGAFDDGTGKYYVGDVAEGDAELNHQPMALPGEDCICLISTTGHLRPHGLLGRLVRPLLGM